MKNKIIKRLIASVLTIFSIGLLSGCSGKKENTENETVKIRLNEVVRSVFYAPMYIAINEGLFLEEGIEIELSTGQGADKTMQQLLSGNADIGFSGPEQVIYIYNQGREDYPVVFAQLTQTDGSFIVGREENPDFEWEDLRGAEIIGARPGGMPQMVFEYVLRNHGLDPRTDVSLVTNIDFTATSGAFKSGTGEYVNLFEPTASMLEKEGSGKILASIGKAAGDIPYTAFYTTKSYMEENPELVQRVTNAIYKGQLWFESHSAEEIADSIISFFPGTDRDIIISVVKNYKEIDALAKVPTIEEEDLNRLMDIIQEYDGELIKERPPYEKIVNNEFAEKAIEAAK